MTVSGTSNDVRGEFHGTVIQAGAIYGGIGDGGTRGAPTEELRGLRSAVASFTNRVDPLAWLRESTRRAAPADHPVVACIQGPHGIGKTELAIKFLNDNAASFGDGIFLVGLGDDPGADGASLDGVLARLLAGLGWSSEVIPADLDGRVALFRTLTEGKRVGILVDDATTAAQVITLLPKSPHAMVLVTSTSAMPGLQKWGYRTFQLTELTDDETVELLHRLLPDDPRLTAEPDAVRALAALCHGMPLLAEAGAALAGLEPATPLAMLVRELREYGGTSALADERPEADAMYQRLYARLSENAARVYRAIGLHPVREVDVWALATATGLTVRETRRCCRELAGLSLVRAAGPTRYWTYDLVQHYARRAAETHDPPERRDRVLRAFAEYYRGGADRADPRRHLRWILRPDRPVSDIPVVLPDLDAARRAREDERADGIDPDGVDWLAANLRAALAFALLQHDPVQGPVGAPGYVWHLAESYDGFLRDTGWSAERDRLLDAAIEDAVACGHPLAEARMRNLRGFSLLEREELDGAEERFTAALRVSEEAGDRRGIGAALECLGIVAYRKAEYERSIAYLRRSHPYLAELDSPQSLALHHLHMGRAHSGLGDHVEASRHFDRAYAGFRDDTGTGDRFNQTKALLGRGTALLGLDRHAEAADALRTALELSRAEHRTLLQVRVLEPLGEAELPAGRHHARRRWVEAEHLYQELHDEDGVKRVRRRLVALGDPDEGDDR